MHVGMNLIRFAIFYRIFQVIDVSVILKREQGYLEYPITSHYMKYVILSMHGL